ncbi:MAG: dihydropteroate synthase [Tannerellaceae bacterium]|nr:dihydropteroate synthase [Tannerellaceae bacterium]
MHSRFINIKGELVSLNTPLVMGILNITPDSFYAGSRKQTEKEIEERIQAILEEGGTIIDLGGYSSRPGSIDIPEEEEINRLEFALNIATKQYPDAILSVDTFRSEIARRCVEKYGVAIINDISGGELDKKMFSTVADLQIPYILMHMRGTPQTMLQHTHYEHLIVETRKYLADKIQELRLLGVNDIIIDPGFGFSKTWQQNYEIMHYLKEFCIFELPLLVGISRKAMIYKFLESTPQDSLTGTIALNTYALLNGADFLRVHDVKEAVETVRIIEKIKQSTNYKIQDNTCGCISE